MTQWNLVIAEKMDRTARSNLARTGGKKGDLSKFVDDAVRAEVLRRDIREIQNEVLTLPNRKRRD